MNNERIKRLESSAYALIASFFNEYVNDMSERFGMISISQVKVSTDISYLDIYVSSMKSKVDLTKELAKYAHDIHKILVKQLRLRKTPRIRFRYDEGGEIAQAITMEIDTLKNL